MTVDVARPLGLRIGQKGPVSQILSPSWSSLTRGKLNLSRPDAQVELCPTTPPSGQLFVGSSQFLPKHRTDRAQAELPTTAIAVGQVLVPRQRDLSARVCAHAYRGPSHRRRGAAAPSLRCKRLIAYTSRCRRVAKSGVHRPQHGLSVRGH